MYVTYPNPGTCPGCGRCNHCGHTPYRPYTPPYYPNVYPYVYPYGQYGPIWSSSGSPNSYVVSSINT